MKNVIHLPVRVLTIFIVLYLLLPNLLFQAFWFRMELSVLTVPALIFSFYFYVKNQFLEEKEVVTFTYWNVLMITLFSFFLVAFSGIGGLCYQTNDYVGHNSKSFDLATNPWPIYFGGADTFGCYYWGFYLVPGLIGKLAGGVSETAIFLWASLGIFLGITMTFIVLKKSVPRLFLFFILGGIGHTVKVLFGIISGTGFTHPIVFIEVWNLLNQLLWAPNQLIPSLMLVALIYYKGIIHRSILSCFFPLTLILIWSIFPTVTLSLVTLLIFFFFGEYKVIRKINFMFFAESVLLPVLISIPILFYFLSSTGIPVRGFIWTFNPLSPILIDYIVCVCLDIIVLWIVWRYLVSNKKEISSAYFYVLLFIIPILALYRFGFANDWLVRGTMPIFMILFFAILRGNFSFKTSDKGYLKLGLKLTLIGFILLCMIGPCSYLYRAAMNNVIKNAILNQVSFTAVPYNKYVNVYEAIKEHHGIPEASQYLGNKKSKYWANLSKRKKEVDELVVDLRKEFFTNKQTRKYLSGYP